INSIFDINEEAEEASKKIDIDISDNEINLILDTIDEGIKDDNTIPEESKEANKMKTYHFLVEVYEKWIKNLRSVGLSYV
ncbi:10598_t:CDS:2, partial [Funneliformis mosseae]